MMVAGNQNIHIVAAQLLFFFLNTQCITYINSEEEHVLLRSKFHSFM